MKKNKKRNKWLSSKNMSLLIGVVIIVIIVVLLKNTIIFDAIESKSINVCFFMTDVFHRPEEISEGVYKIAKAKGIRNDVVIFGFDEKSLVELGRYPWPRNVYAKFLDNVNKDQNSRPSGVLIDVLFTEYSENKVDDMLLVNALAKYRDNTVIDLFADTSSQIPNVSGEIEERIQLIQPLGIETEDEQIQVVNVITPPIREIIKSGVLIGPATALYGTNPRLASKEGADKTARRFALVVKIGGRYYPSTVLRMAMLHYGVSESDLEIEMGTHIILKNATIPETGQKRDIVVPIDSQGTMLINFHGRPGTFQVRSFSDVVEGRVSARYFADKLLLVGVYAEGLQDIHNTPYGPMFGIEMMANAVTQLLNREFISFTNDWVTILLIIAFGILISYIVGRRSILMSYIVTFALAVIYFFIVVFLFDRSRLILNLSAPLITAVITLFSMIVYRILTEEKEKKAIQGMFSNYVSKSVVDELIKHPEKLELGGEDKEITVLFSDIRGFTTLSERLTPQELVSHLNEYLSAMTEIIFEYEGTLDKYVGDEIMAFWNAPIEQGNHAELACRTALDQMKRLHELNEVWPQEKRLNIGIGLNTGIMTVGNMGSTSRMDYTLMGDNVNLGARLEGTNKVYGTNIIISEHTYEKIKDLFMVRELDNIRVKGKKKPVKIFELLDLKDGVAQKVKTGEE
ncbi:MAG: adenylate/guanylate cyclase domain-containing protein [Spirochaetes bacterium]|nr:adenylate/guanylate cyclase domain-containing protein [Spirochaetota bacterium]